MKKRYKILIGFVLLIIAFITAYKIIVTIKPPKVSETTILEKERTLIAEDFYQLDDSWLKKNKHGLWELFISGNSYEMGVKNGILTKELAHYQEEAFVEQIKELVPSDFFLNFLKYFIAWFNKDIDQHIPQEFLREIYGVSLSASDEFEFIAPNYQRILNYHAAHDIGHTINNMNLVACTAFGLNNSRSEDGSLIVGRNMDFYAGDKFAENKIVAFCKPDSGYPFTYITWAGLVGVITGMNNQGLSIALNSAKSDLPTSAKTPVSILAREILQYASTIDEALAIAQKRETFVAEALYISSAKDKDFAVIEKSTKKTVLYQPSEDELILSNHYQSKAFAERELTIKNKKETETVYRWNRVKELLDKRETHNVESVVSILRDQKGLKEANIGFGNEMTINQLIAHHSVVFKPEQLLMWVSVGPYQLGEYIAYDLNTIFSDTLNFHKNIYTENLEVKEDAFLHSDKYSNFVLYKEMTKKFEAAINSDEPSILSQAYLDKYEILNPNYYYTYYLIGQCHAKLGEIKKAKEYYNLALSMEISKQYQRDKINEDRMQLIKEQN